jgi:hypothetical protein
MTESYVTGRLSVISEGRLAPVVKLYTREGGSHRCHFDHELGGLSNATVKKKVKVTLVQALRLCTGRTAHRGSGGIALLFHDQGTRRR